MTYVMAIAGIVTFKVGLDFRRVRTGVERNQETKAQLTSWRMTPEQDIKENEEDLEQSDKGESKGKAVRIL